MLWGLEKLSFETIKGIVKQRFDPKTFKPNEYWMIIWIDKVFVDENQNLLFTAVLARLDENDLEESIFSTRKLDLSKPVIVSLPLRLIRILPPGTIVKDGFVLYKKQIQYFRKRKLSIQPVSMKQIDISSWTHGKDLLKALGLDTLTNGVTDKKISETIFGRQSKIFVWENREKKTSRYDYDFVIFPCTEMARFYWFPSTRMVEALILPGSISKQKNKLWVPESIMLPTASSPFHYIQVRDEMYLRDTHIISRIAFDLAAKRSALKISLSVKNRELEGGSSSSFYINTDFPFDGTSEVSYFGMEFKVNNIRFCLVLELRECSGKWPFESLRYDRESETPVEDPFQKPKGKKTTYFSKPKRKEKIEIEPEDLAQNNFDPSKYHPSFDKDNLTTDQNLLNDRMLRKAIIIDTGKRFSTLPKDRKRVKREKIIPPKELQPPKPRRVTNLSTNDNETNKPGSLGMEVGSDEKGNPEAKTRANLSRFMNEMAKEFSDRGAEVRFHNLIHEYGQESIFHIRLIPSGISNSTSHSFCHVKGKSRMIIIMYVEYNGQCFIVVELQPKSDNEKLSLKVLKKIVKHEESLDQRISKVDVEGVIDNLIKSNGKYSMNSYSIFRLYHLGGSGDQYVDKIIGKVNI